MYKSKLTQKSICIQCSEEIKKANLSRKYAHELKNIFITISTVVNSEIENNHQNYNPVSNDASLACESGEFSPYIMEKRKSRPSIIHDQGNTQITTKVNDRSPFTFLKTLCDYGKTLIKEINEMGQELVANENNKVEYFNVSKAINFCVDMFETKKTYDESKKNLEIYSDINFSYDKEINSISETGFKMVLINLLTNSYKFTIKGHIVVRAVSIPKEKKIRILVKDSGKGFNPKEFKKNGCFYVYEKNQDLNADGSGLGLSIVNEILTKFNIKLDCSSDTEKGGSLFYFDINDSSPYYDEINPQKFMTDSLNKMINDINTGKNSKNIIAVKTGLNKNKNKVNRKSVNFNNFKINLKYVENNKRNSFMEDKMNNSNKKIEGASGKIIKNNNRLGTNNLLVLEKNDEKIKRKSFGNFPIINENLYYINSTPNKKKIGRFYSLENSTNFKLGLNFNSHKKNGQNLLQQIIEDGMSRNATYNIEGYEKERINKKKTDKANVNYKKLLNKKFNKSDFYLFDIRKLFLKSEIYINIYLKSFKRSQTEIVSPKHTKSNNNKKNIQMQNQDKIYIIICDDEEFVAMSAKELIINYYLKKGKEPHVYFTPNGIECVYLMYKLSIIENKKIEFILLDMEMPYLNGINTCNIIKSIKETNIPIYILSGDEPKNCNADGYCNKPLNEIDIINKLDKRK